MTTPSKTVCVYAFCTISTLFSLALFLRCYFPLKQGLEGHSTAAEIPPEPVSGREGVPAAHYARVVLMVIDALRADFVLGATPFMPFTQRLLSERHGIAFVARTHPPTVTLPRIKSITTGSIPGFVDVVMNFGSTVLTEDNIMTQLKHVGKTLTFFGDDTWLNLFPDHFTRSDGTTSFFVTDYTEVDDNVTRHLDGELASDDWDVMTLHYLGLDHIGHLAGPFSPLVQPKLLEMDAVVQQIYTALQAWSATEMPSLLVICGDHGMSDQGGHGGASLGEVLVPVIMLSPHTQFQQHNSAEYPNIQQIDLCPTLSTLLGLPIPKNNLGSVQVSALPANTPLRDRMRTVQLNAAQLVTLLAKNVDGVEQDPSYQLYQSALRSHREWLATENSSSPSSHESSGTQVLLAYQDAIQRMSQRISEMSTHYDMYGITLCVTALWLNLVTLVLVKLNESKLSLPMMYLTGPLTALMVTAAVFGHMTMCTSQYHSDILCGFSLSSLSLQLLMLSAIVVPVYLLSSVCWAANVLKENKKNKALNSVEMMLVYGIIVHTLSLVSSSFVEEEHQTWYFFTSTLHTAVLLCCVGDIITKHFATQSADTSSRNGDADENTGMRFERKSKTHDTDDMYTELNSPDQHNLHHQKVYKKRSAEWKPPQTVTAAAVVAILCLLRVLRRWNQTGNKWLHVPDVGDWLVKPENKWELSSVLASSLLCIFLTRCSSLWTSLDRLSCIGALVFVYWSKAGTGAVLQPFASVVMTSVQGVTEARIAYLFILLLAITNLYQLFNHGASTSSQSHSQHQQSQNIGILVFVEGLQAVWLCLMCLLFRPHNAALVALLSLTERLVCGYVVHAAKLRPSCQLLYCLAMGQAFFFFQGNSHSLSTVDVAAGYTGLSGYLPALTGVQMCLSTYGAVFFWLMSCLKYIHLTCPNDVSTDNICQWLSSAYTDIASTALLTRALPLAVYTTLVTFMRYHLFVWTVFSPKLLYEGMLTVILSVFSIMCLYVGSVFRKNIGKMSRD